MVDTGETLLHLFEEERRMGRQSEDQRASIASLVIVIASVINGVLTQTGFHLKSLPLSILLILLGSYGMIFNAKLYERFRLHDRRADKIRNRLDELFPDAQIRVILMKSDEEQDISYPIISRKIRLYRLWIGLHSLILLQGVIYSFIIILNH